MTTVLLLLKYFSWALTVGIPFVSTWFFDFTKTDKETGKKSLTPVGAKAIYFSGMALVCALILSLWTDYNAAQKETAAARAAVADKAVAEEERSRGRHFQMELTSTQDELKKGQDDIRQLLFALESNFSALTESQRESVRNVVRKLSSFEDIRTQYPDLFEKITSARDTFQLKDATNEALWRKITERVKRDIPTCADMRINGLEHGLSRGFPGGTFDFGTKSSQSDWLTHLRYMVDGEGVALDLNVIPATGDFSAANQMLDKGYYFEFQDGGKSNVLRCEAKKSTGSCEDRTGRSGQALAVYRLLQSKPVANVIVGDRSFSVAPSESDIMLKTFACIAP